VSDVSPLIMVLLFLGGSALALFFGGLLFRFLGKLADRARPTTDNEARPGHDNLGDGLIGLIAPVAALAFFGIDVGRALRVPEFWPIVLLVVVFVVTPIGGAIALLMWKNARLTLSDGYVIATNLLGVSSQPAKVIAAKMSPPLRHPGRVGFQFSNGWEFADTSWINIRWLYERVSSLGAAAEPWREKATWKDIWSR
jgi:hypothetical protein